MMIIMIKLNGARPKFPEAVDAITLFAVEGHDLYPHSHHYHDFDASERCWGWFLLKLLVLAGAMLKMLELLP